jgi:hypothetical protein
MAEDWVIVKDPMAGDYKTPHDTPRQLTPKSADYGAAWTLDVALLMERLWALYAETKKIELQADWLWNMVVSSFGDSCGDLDKLGVLKF